MKSGQKYKAHHVAKRQKEKNNGCRCRIIREDELTAQVPKTLCWEQMDEMRSEAEVERIAVLDGRVEIEKKMEQSA